VTQTRLKSESKRRDSTRTPRIVAAPRSSTDGSRATDERDRPSRQRQVKIGGDGGGDDLRYHLASLVRMSDNIVAKAVQVYDRLFALDARDQAEIHLHLGADLAKDGNVRGAIAALRKAAQLRPEDGEICLQLGQLYLERRKAPEAALQEFDKASELGIESAKLHLLKAEALSSLERNTEAITELERALELDPGSAEASYLLGVALDASGDFKRAADAFRYAIGIEPNEIAYHQSLGLTLESAGKRREAIRCFKRALELERRQARSS
jgi:tetratricopeptide (TPR) repeat protein